MFKWFLENNEISSLVFLWLYKLIKTFYLPLSSVFLFFLYFMFWYYRTSWYIELLQYKTLYHYWLDLVQFCNIYLNLFSVFFSKFQTWYCCFLLYSIKLALFILHLFHLFFYHIFRIFFVSTVVSLRTLAYNFIS